MKNRYIGRTFIMPGQTQRKVGAPQAQRHRSEFKGRRCCWWTTPSCGAPPPSRSSRWPVKRGRQGLLRLGRAGNSLPNVYGIDMPTANELIAHGREVEEVCKLIGADGLIFRIWKIWKRAVREINPELRRLIGPRSSTATM